MEWSSSSKNEPALPSVQLNSQQRPILPWASEAPSNYSMTSSTPTKLSQPSKEQWEMLKPVIRDLYLEKDIKQRELPKILGEEYGFKITPKQLTNHLKSWGFWKNTTQSQRIAMVDTKNALKESGFKITPAKVTRWKKELFRRNDHRDLHVPGSLIEETARHDVQEHKVPEMYATTQMLQQPESDITSTEWPIFSCDSVDVQNSPDLTRLFSQLGIFRDDVPELELPPPIIAPPTYPEHVSCYELNEIHIDKQSHEGVEAQESTQHGSKSRRLVTHDSSFLDSKRKKRGSGWPFIKENLDFPLPPYFTPSSYPTPFNEVYVFPPTPVTRPPRPRYTPSVHEILDFDSKLRHLQRTGLFPLANSRNLAMIRSLVDSCLSSKDTLCLEKAEDWCQQLLNNEKYVPRRSIEMLTDMYNLVLAVFQKTRYEELLEMIDEIEVGLGRLGAYNEEFLIHILLLKGWILGEIRDHTNQRKQYRNCLQLCINAFGPSHRITLEAMFHFSFLEEFQQREELLRTALIIGQKNSITTFGVLPNLGDLMNEKGLYQAAVSLGRKAIEKARDNVGGGSQSSLADITNSLGCIIHSLLGQGKIQESIETVKEFLEFDIKLRQLDLVHVFRLLGRISYDCRTEHEVSLLLFFLKTVKNWEGLQLHQILQLCRDYIQGYRYKTGIGDSGDHELFYINYLETWYQKQIVLEEEKAAGFARECLLLEE